MNWSQAFQRRTDRARSEIAATRPAHPLRPVRAVSICVASGKGGTGKSIVSAALATLFAERGRTLLVDADLGVGNAHILQNVQPERTFVDLIRGRTKARELVVPCRPGLDLIGAGSGVSHMASLSLFEQRLIAEALCEIERDYDHVVVDSAAGISEQNVSFAAACDVVLIVTTPDVTAMTDAYAFLKVLSTRVGPAIPLVVVNRVGEPGEGERVATRMSEVSAKFLGRELRWIGSLPDDRAVVRSVAARRAVVLAEPSSEISMAMRSMTTTLLEELERAPRAGLGSGLVDHLRTLEAP